jgi:hypothetical protein
MMITIKEYAKKHKISMRAARWQLEDKMRRGLMDRKRGPSNLYLYYEVIPMDIRWHDPFNKIERRTA